MGKRKTKVLILSHAFLYHPLVKKQGRKRPLDTPKRMIERREREGEREKGRRRDIEREGEIREREIERERERGRERER